MQYGFIVTHENIAYDTPAEWDEYEDHIVGPRDVSAETVEALKAGKGKAFALLDDDRIPYMRGRWFDDGDRSPLEDIGYAYGCTMQTDGRGKVIIG